ncbi:putative metal-binding protein, possibly nucleic-acid binding protein [Desulfosporosinus acidiphilus SJ4]|uniref:Putative metal-binding protein, possibly nucleic-acid binding protein n=1 Tax=Desulfosporosinus acidiphilus (strain DSM 22704 / JCM 16185 / SJ4) TaxID=646529 RepID=I4D9R9_DESAJ|nr:putative metal-binding protein, possibly nucleic-acid binding protein [Desulfosporosinus acidiphilus SJ4]
MNVAQVRRTSGESIHFDVVENFSPFELGTESFSFSAPVHVQLQVINTNKAVLVSGTIETELKVICGRCLEPFDYPLNLPYQDEWAFPAQATEELLESALLLEKDEVDISQRIFEQLVLALPMKFVCSEECQGLCLTCGANLNQTKCSCKEEVIDPRFAALAKWQAND